MESKIAKSQVVLVKIECKNDILSYTAPVSVNMDRVDGMYVSQVVASSAVAETGVYSISTDLVSDGIIALVTDGRTSSPNTFFKMPGSTINGNYTFRVDDVQSTHVSTALVIGILLTFVKFA